jgi:hypothetical protein
MSEIILSNDKLPDLTNWDNTRKVLRSVSHLVKHIQVKFIKPKSIHLEHSISINKDGINTDELHEDLGRLVFNYRLGEIYLENSSKEKKFLLNLQDQSLNSLTEKLLSEFKDLGHPIELNREELTDSNIFDFNTEQTSLAADILWYFYSALARFKSSLFGTMSPLVLWSHHFDFAFLYFPDPNKQTEQDSHMCFGLAPTLDENYNNPYAYFYAWDGPNKKYVKTEVGLPENVSWQTHYTVLKYDDLREKDDPAKFFEDHYKKLFDLHISKLS